MEQKRTLWILIAAGVFLCVVIGAAFLIFGNSQKNNATAMSLKDSGVVWVAPEDSHASFSESSYSYSESQPVVESQKADALSQGATSITPGEVPPQGAQPPAVPPVAQADSITVIANGATNVYNIPEGSASLQNGTTTIDLNSLKGGATSSSSTVTAQNQVTAQAMQQAKTEPPKVLTPVASSAAPKASSSAKKATSAASSATAAKTTKKAAPAPATAKTDRYWVQVGSFVNKKNADEARSVLEEKAIKCEVFTYEDGGTLKYRLRAGDYSSRTEAEYWQKQIDSIEYFAKNTGGSLIVNTHA